MLRRIRGPQGANPVIVISCCARMQRKSRCDCIDRITLVQWKNQPFVLLGARWFSGLRRADYPET